MISITSSSYPTLVRAAERQAARLGLADDVRQSVPVQVQEPSDASGSSSDGGASRSRAHVVDVRV